MSVFFAFLFYHCRICRDVIGYFLTSAINWIYIIEGFLTCKLTKLKPFGPSYENPR